MPGVLFAIGVLEALGGVTGLASIVWGLFKKTSWPPVYLWASAGFYLVVLSGAWRLMQMASLGRPLSTLAQLAQLVTWKGPVHAIQLLAGPQLALSWSRGVMTATLGAGAYVSVSPPPVGSVGAAPEFSWAMYLFGADSSLFRSFSFNLFPLLALVALGVSWYLDRRTARQVLDEAAELGRANAPRHRLRTPIR